MADKLKFNRERKIWHTRQTKKLTAKAKQIAKVNFQIANDHKVNPP